MLDKAQTAAAVSFFNLHLDGVGYLNKVRWVTPMQGTDFLACTVSALRGNTVYPSYTRIDCTVWGEEVRKIIKQLESDVKAEHAVMIGFRLGDIHMDTFQYEKGERKGQQGVSLKGRLLKIRFAKVHGKAIEIAQSAPASGSELIVY
jgi:hypothetical protein